jgi:hypothetical protein
MGMSAVWIAGAAIAVTYADVRIARLIRYAAFEACDFANHRLCRCGNCWRELMDFASFVDQSVINLALIALAPIAVAWAGACALVAIFHVIVGATSR